MFRKLFFGCLGLFLLLSGLGYADGYSPKVGEVLEYKVFVKSFLYGGYQIVKVTSKDTYNGEVVYNIHSEMTTTGIAKSFYDYSQVEDLVLDADGLYPWCIKQEIREGKNIIKEEVYFNYSTKTAVRLISKNGGPKERMEIALPGFVHDGLSLQFFLRGNRVINDINKLYFYSTNGTISENTFTVTQADQEIKAAFATFQKYFQIIGNISNITVLISDTPERYPFIIKKMADFGAIEMKLFKVKQTVNEFRRRQSLVEFPDLF